jgi:peroxiredoxin
MRNPFALLSALALVSCNLGSTGEAAAGEVLARAEVGQPAPAFTLPDLDGNQVSLADHSGEVVVLEWFSPECPYVVYAHTDGPLAALPGQWTERGVAWLAINSNAPGTQGSDPAVNRTAATEWGLPSSVLLDPEGDVGRAYGAKNTPQMFIVGRDGTLVYNGAVDNAPRGRVKGKSHELWIDDALTDVLNGAAVRRANNQPYGCTVKYGS